MDTGVKARYHDKRYYLQFICFKAYLLYRNKITYDKAQLINKIFIQITGGFISL